MLLSFGSHAVCCKEKFGGKLDHVRYIAWRNDSQPNLKQSQYYIDWMVRCELQRFTRLVDARFDLQILSASAEILRFLSLNYAQMIREEARSLISLALVSRIYSY